MDDLQIVGQVVGGKFGDIVIRQKAGTNFRLEICWSPKRMVHF